MKLDADAVIISNIDKGTHYMNQIWNCNIFLQEMMTIWGQRAAGLRTYGNAVTYFNNKIAGIELYKVATGNTSGQNGFSQANAVQDLTAKVVTSLEGNKEHNKGEFKKRDTVIVNAVHSVHF